MPRPKSFDEHEALQEIVGLFWRNGYSATGMDLICEHLSLTKPSIYNTFGDKAALFRRAVDWYLDDMLAGGSTWLKGEAPVSEEFRALFRSILVEPEKDVVTRGCLLGAALVELQYIEPELFAYVREQIEKVPMSFKSYLADARAAGRLRPDTDTDALGDYLITVFQGMRMRSRAMCDQAELAQVIDTAMAPVRAAEAATA